MVLPALHTQTVAPKPRTIQMVPRPKPTHGTGHWSTGTIELWRKMPKPRAQCWERIDTQHYHNRHERQAIIQHWKHTHYRPFQIRIIPNA